MKETVKRRARKGIALLLALTMLVSCMGLTALAAPGDTGSQRATGQPELKLWYDEPASQTVSGSEVDVWQKSTLPIGNGHIGAGIYGEIATERLVLNEQTLWLGGPSESRPDYMGGNVVENHALMPDGKTLRIDDVKSKFAAGKVSEAQSSAGWLTGEGEWATGGYGYYAPWGELQITTAGVTSATAGTYQRWLSLDNALAGVDFESGGVTYHREYLTSNPDNVLAVKLTASQSATFNITIAPSDETAGKSLTYSNNERPNFNNDPKYATVSDGNDTLKLCGQLADNQLKFASYLKAVPTGTTTVQTSDDHITVTGTEVTLFFSAATDYAQDYPVYRTGESDAALAARVKKVTEAAAAKGYETVKSGHKADYDSLYTRLTLDLGQEATSKTTDDLLKAYNAGTASATERRLLEVMLYQYGRYMTIASSRKNSQLPSNLQGIWNARHTDSPWHSDFHTNVNLQMNYWPTYSSNLAECADPLVRYIDSLREPGRVTAKVYAGIVSTPENPENGFMAHTQCTPYGWTCPGWSFSWGWSPAAISWMLQNCWEYYEYTGDLEYMKNNIYPMMKEYARLYEQLLVDVGDYQLSYAPVNEAGSAPYLATVPSYSPEHGPITAGNTYEQVLTWQLMEDTIRAAELLGLDSDKVGNVNTPGTWKYIQNHLLGPIVVGEGGQVKEWYEEVDISKDANGNTMGQGYNHRHISHMLGLFPGDLAQSKDEWFEASRVSMENRTDESTGWGMGQRINTWARLRDGDKAHKLIGDLFRGGMYPNLWDAHPPFQIDGNFGYTSGVDEMLMQSNMGFIDLLPALPSAWTDGRVDGLLARGNFELDMSWSDNALTSVDILSKNGGECSVSYPNLAGATITDASGNPVKFTADSNDRVTFNTAKGQTYTISDVPYKLSTVEGGEALRTADDSVTVCWTAKDGETYQVYRQIDDGEVLPVGNPVEGGSFVDETAYETLGTFRYYFSVNGADLTTSPVNVQDLRNMGRVDDQYSLDGTNANGSPIVFGGSWGTYNSDSSNYKGTSRWIDYNAVTGQTATLTFLGTGVQAIGYPYYDSNSTARTTTFDLTIDGQETKQFTATRTGPRQSVMLGFTDLKYGIHTVVLKMTGSGKLDFDGFNVLGGGGAPVDPTEPEVLTISTVGGIEKLWNAGETVQFTANITDGVTWTVTSDTPHTQHCAYPEHKFSWNAETHTLTAGLTDEVVTVTATKGSKSDSKTITIRPATTVTIIEDHMVSNGSNVRNSQITWGGSWGNPYMSETKHHGSSKTESAAVGNTIELTFTGTSVAVYGTVHFNNGAASVTLDSVAKDDIHPCGDTGSTDLAQQKLAEYTGLSNTQHTLTLTIKAANNAAGASKSNFVLDFFEVKAPNPNVPQTNLEALKAAVADAGKLNQEDYTTDSWEPLSTALATAGSYLNNDVTATQDQVDTLVTTIRNAIEDLDPKPLAAPENLAAAQIGGTSITVKWDAVSNATGYEVSVDNGTPVPVTGTAYQITGLEPAQEYTVSVKSKNSSGTSNAVTLSVETADTIAPTAPQNLNYDGTRLTWGAATDKKGVTGYKVYVGTGDPTPVTTTSHTVSISNGTTVRVTAVDATGNESAPAVLLVASSHTVTVTNATLADGGSSGTFKVGEAVTVTATVPAGHIFTGWTAEGVTLEARTTETTLYFAMPDNEVTLTANTEAKSWSITANLTNLTSNAPATVADSAELTVKLSAADPYRLPDAIQVTRNGERLQAPWVTYDVTTGNVQFRAGVITGNVVITAVGSVPEPTGETYTAEDPFQLPVTKGTSTVLEAEKMILTGATRGYGPSHGNQHIVGAAGDNTFVLHYNAPTTGLYDMVLNYSSGRDANDPAGLNWSGDKVASHTGSLPNTLESGEALYKTTTLQLEVTTAGQGIITFTSSKAVGLNIDSITFALAQSAVHVSSIDLDLEEATLYLNGAPGENTVTINATVAPGDAENPTLRWESSDSSVAAVTQAGVVTARKNGTTTIKAMAMDGSGVEASAEITVKTRVSGEVIINGSPKFGQSLVASINQISSQEAKEGLEYQWNQNDNPIPGATDRTYEIKEGDIGQAITVTVRVTGDYFVGETNGTISDPVTIDKADGPAVVVTLGSEDCTDENDNDGKITGLNPDRTYEYQKIGDGDTWQTSEGDGERTEITGLTPGNYHIRVKETATMNAGPVSRTLTILGHEATGNAINIADSFTGGVVRADMRKANEGDHVTLTVIPEEGYQLVADSLQVNDGEVAVSGTGDTFTFTMPSGEATVTAEFELKTYTITHSLDHVTCTLAEHSHKVTHGDTPTIVLEPEEGYDLPETIVVTLTHGGARFTHYTYVNGMIKFDAGIPGDLTIEGNGVKKTVQVFYKMYGLTSLDGPRSVEWKDALNLTLEAKDGYARPETITLTMNDTPLTAGVDGDYTYVKETGAVAVKAGVLTADVTISAEGASNKPQLSGVTITSSGDKAAPKVGDQLTAGVEEADAFPDYQWIRVDAEGDETFIEGATNRTYVLKTADEGYIIKVAATGTSNYSGTVYDALTAKVTADSTVTVSGVTLDRQTATITAQGASLRLRATVSPSNANQTVIWSSNDPDVARVSSDSGLVTGLKVGTATITATTVSGGYTASCVVNVVGITMAQTKVSVNVNSTVPIAANIPSDLPGREVEWSSSDPSIATVDKNGVVTGVAVGTATITVTKGGFTATCEVTVRTPSSGGGSTSSGSSTTTETKDDGTKVTTVTKPDGTKVETTETPDGTKAVVETKPDGSKTQTVEQADGTKSELVATKDGDVTITVTDKSGEELVKTEIPATIPEPETKFEDVTEAAPWAEEAIDKMAGLKLVNGTGGNKYSPVAPMTRGSLATVLHRLSQGKTDYDVTFKDVAQGKYYTEGVAWAAKANVVKGISEDVFAPDKVITREQLAVMLARYAKLVGLNTKADAKTLEQFADGEKTGDWAVDGMAWCVENGILKGKGQNNLDPTADVTRAEVAVMLDRFIALLK